MSTTPILQPGQMETATGPIPELLLPPADLFARRALRFHSLAEGHALAGYLVFLANLAEWQQHELDRIPLLPLPDSHLLEQCRAHAMPPLSPEGWPSQPVWHSFVRQSVAAVRDHLPSQGQDALLPLLKADKNWLETQAMLLVHGQGEPLDLAAAPFIGAALQIQWTHLARQLRPDQIGRPEHPSRCPVCGSHPVASLIRADGRTQGLRYLHCALCGSQWHVVRATCSQCGNTKNIGYAGLEGNRRVVQAETCPECCGFLKIISTELDACADPIADDIATLTLDLLLAEEHQYANYGVNFFML